MKPIRIVYVLTSLGMGGAERVAITLATRMARRGHHVALLVLRPRQGEEWLTTLPVTSLEMRKTPTCFLAGMGRGRRFLADFRPDLVHSHGFHANVAARLLKLFAPPTVVLSTVHNIYEGGWRRMLAYHLTDGLSRRTAAVSEAAARRFIHLKAVSGQKCIVIPNAFDLDEFLLQPGRRAIVRAQMAADGPAAEDGFLWLAAGRITPGKDYPNLLRAFARVHIAHPDVKLWIAGEATGLPHRDLRKLAIELKVDGCVRWLGLRRDIPALLDAADAFVQASAWEGMPLAIGEAMAMEKPVVATDVGGVRELLGDAGGLVRAHDSQALADAMMALMRKPLTDRQKLGTAARARIEREFNMDSRVVQWEDLYAQLLQK